MGVCFSPRAGSQASSGSFLLGFPQAQVNVQPSLATPPSPFPVLSEVTLEFRVTEACDWGPLISRQESEPPAGRQEGAPGSGTARGSRSSPSSHRPPWVQGGRDTAPLGPASLAELSPPSLLLLLAVPLASFCPVLHSGPACTAPPVLSSPGYRSPIPDPSRHCSVSLRCLTALVPLLGPCLPPVSDTRSGPPGPQGAVSGPAILSVCGIFWGDPPFGL